MLLSPSLTLSVNLEAELYSGVHSFTSGAVCREVADVPHSGWLERLLIHAWNKSHSLGEGRKKRLQFLHTGNPHSDWCYWCTVDSEHKGGGVLVGQDCWCCAEADLHSTACRADSMAVLWMEGRNGIVSEGVRWAKWTCKDSYVCDTACIMAKCWGVGAITEWGWRVQVIVLVYFCLFFFNLVHDVNLSEKKCFSFSFWVSEPKCCLSCSIIFAVCLSCSSS